MALPHLAQPVALLLLPPLAALVVLVWRTGTVAPRSRRTRLLLACRLAAVTALVLALAGVSIRGGVDRQAVVFVADVSASTDAARQGEQDFIARAVAAKRPDDAFAVVTTARQALVDRVLGFVPEFDQFRTSVAPDGTDLAAGLRLAGSLLPSAYRTRVVLVSDGQETGGDAVAQARLLNARGVETDVVPLGIPSGPEALLDHATAPSTVQADERFTVDVAAVSTVETAARVDVYLDGALVDQRAVTLEPGTTELTFGARSSAPGLHDVRATLEADLDTLPQNNEARAIVEVQGAPRVLVVEQRPGEGANVAGALAGAGMLVDTRAPSELPSTLEELGSYNAVVLADVSADSLDDARMELLRTYVHDLGRGLLAIGGESSFGQGNYAGTPLDDVLPVSSTVRTHRDQGRVAMVLVIDRSGSMSDDPANEGVSKIEMARRAATLAVDQLAPGDEIGVLAFDSFNHWIVPFTHVQDVGIPAIDQQIGTLTADGGTNIPPAVSEALGTIQRATDAEYRHVILMTDGMSCCGGDYTPMLDQMRLANITLSTIAIGADADQDLLTRLARLGGGRYYFADRSTDIPRFMTRETRLATRGPLVEGNIQPRLSTADPLVANAARSGMPALTGYLVTSPKDLAEELLGSTEGDPILARWQYGLGRAVAFTSDLRGRWSADWIAWPGEQQLLAGLANWTIPQAQGALRVDLRADGGSGRVAVEETQPAATPSQMRVSVLGPDGSTQSLELLATGPGRFEGTFATPALGAYLAHVEDLRDGQPTALAVAGLAVSYSPEYRTVADDPARLQQIARAGGGHVLASPADAFAPDLRPAYSDTPLTRPLLALAVVLLPLEIALRRLRIGPLDWLDRAPARTPTLVSLGGDPRQRRAPSPSGARPGRPASVPPAPRPAPSPTPAPRTAPAGSVSLDVSAEEESPYKAMLRWQQAKRGERDGAGNP
jgi:Ca-activated chloride channel homolog